MKNVEARILEYPDLSPAEQQAVDDYVHDHPQWAALLEDVKALDALLGDARAPDKPPHAEASDREERVRRLRALEAETEAPAAHFEALMGHPPSGRSEERSPASGRVSEPAGWGVPRPDRAARAKGGARVLRGRWVRYAAVALLAVAVLYGALFAASRLSQSDMERLALVEGDRLSVEGYGLRGMRTRSGPSETTAGDSTRLDQRYLRGLRLLRAARTSTLGLFPRYDDAQVGRAARELEAVAEDAETDSFLQLEALFFLGKARLAQGDRVGATRALRRVVTGEGRLAPEAQEILTTLYEDAAYDGPQR
jgi:hypothetical protein